MPLYRVLSGWHTRTIDGVRCDLGPGDTFDMSEESAVSWAEACGSHLFEQVSGGSGAAEQVARLLSLPVARLTDELAGLTDETVLLSLYEQEQAGAARKGALGALEAKLRGMGYDVQPDGDNGDAADGNNETEAAE